MSIYHAFHKKFYKIRNMIKLLDNTSQIVTQMYLREVTRDIAQKNPQELLLSGWKAFSQCDEDGIIAEIFKRIGTTNKVAIEIGCGNGLENNTHYLLLNSWKAVWIDGAKSNVHFIRHELGTGYDSLLDVTCAIVTRENVQEIVTTGLSKIHETSADLLSIDIDGNDVHVLSGLRLEEINPRVIIMEYNPTFRPPLDITVPYDLKHAWDFDMYHGASLQTLYNHLSPRGYALVGCNISGYNAFFVKRSILSNLPDLTPEEAYQPARLFAVRFRSGLAPSLTFLKNSLQQRLKTIVVKDSY